MYSSPKTLHLSREEFREFTWFIIWPLGKFKDLLLGVRIRVDQLGSFWLLRFAFNPMTGTGELPLLLGYQDPSESLTSHIAPGSFSGFGRPGIPYPPGRRRLGSRNALASTSLAAPGWVSPSLASFPTSETLCPRPRCCPITGSVAAGPH